VYGGAAEDEANWEISGGTCVAREGCTVQYSTSQSQAMFFFLLQAKFICFLFPYSKDFSIFFRLQIRRTPERTPPSNILFQKFHRSINNHQQKPKSTKNYK
jgi:hypothetical protein